MWFSDQCIQKESKKNGGGVSISVHDSLTAIETDNHDSNCEVI